MPPQNVLLSSFHLNSLALGYVMVICLSYGGGVAGRGGLGMFGGGGGVGGAKRLGKERVRAYRIHELAHRSL